VKNNDPSLIEPMSMQSGRARPEPMECDAKNRHKLTGKALIAGADYREFRGIHPQRKWSIS
jgi:hypothetical protein